MVLIRGTGNPKGVPDTLNESPPSNKGIASTGANCYFFVIILLDRPNLFCALR